MEDEIGDFQETGQEQRSARMVGQYVLIFLPDPAWTLDLGVELIFAVGGGLCE